MLLSALKNGQYQPSIFSTSNYSSNPYSIITESTSYKHSFTFIIYTICKQMSLNETGHYIDLSNMFLITITESGSNCYIWGHIWWLNKY